MITRIKKIKDVGVFKNFDIKFTDQQKDFEKKNLIYGYNTFGKSTICDILKDLSEDDTNRIKKRKTIPGGENQNIIINIPGKPATLDGNVWKNNSLKNQIMVFDSEFMINNVFDGSQLIEDRETKEKFTDFILGDKGVALAQEIEQLKRDIKEKKIELSGYVPKSQTGKSDSVIKKYVKNSIKESLEELQKKQESLFQQKNKNEQLEENRALIKGFSLLSIPQCRELNNFFDECEEVKEILNSSYSMSEETVITFENHIQKVCHGNNDAKEWISTGIHIMGDDCLCPFCGQEIKDKNLVDAFSEYLSDDYQKYIKNLHDRIEGVSFNQNDWSLAEKIIELKNKIDKSKTLFGESVNDWSEELDVLYQECLIWEKENKKSIAVFQEKVSSLLNSKKALSNVRVNLDTEIVSEIKVSYDERIKIISLTIEKINKEICKIKEEIESNTFVEKKLDLQNQLEEIKEKIDRINEDEDCNKWITLYDNITLLDRKAKEKSKALETDQADYLDKYFDSIDSIFTCFGGSKFKIEKGDFNNRGFKKVFGVNISFNNVLLSDNELTSTVFSESDKRALALAIFIAKIQCMSSEEKEKIILVFDDPVTSFDDNRMKSVINKLVSISDDVEQMFIFSHNFMFSKKISDSYSDQFLYLKIARIIGKDSNGLFDMDDKQEFLTGFDKEYLKVSQFINAKIDNITGNDLRIFLEEYLKTIFAKQYEQNGLGKKKLGEQIDELKNLGLISDDVNNKLHYYRNELNSESHTFQMDSIEDDRNFAAGFINYLFSNVHMG